MMRNSETAELKRLQREASDLLQGSRLSPPPLLFLLKSLVEWFEAKHIELVRRGDFSDARRAFNPVFIHLPAEGCRLTELAARASMTKQAMGELVDELVERGYLRRFPDPHDGRAKIIVRAGKGLLAHKATIRAFKQIEKELETLLGAQAMNCLRSDLAKSSEEIEINY